MNKTILTLVAFATLFISCDKKDEPKKPVTQNNEFIHSVLVGGQNTYLSLFKDLNVGETNVTNSKVHPMSSFITTYNSDIYIVEPFDSKIVKYRQENGNLVQIGSTLLFDAQTFPMSIIFESKTKAYVPCAATGVLSIINPETMTKIKDINLTEYVYGGKTPNDPSPEPTTGVISDGILYLCLTQDKVFGQYNFHPVSSLLMIKTSDNSVIKHITNTESGFFQSSGYYPFTAPTVDEKGDIYVYNMGGLSGMGDGFLRIKKGTQEFDPNYEFSISGLNISDVTGNKAKYLYTKTYESNGVLYGFLDIPGYNTDPTNPDPSIQAAQKVMQPFKVDLYNKTVTKLSLPASSMTSTAICKSGDNIIFGMETTDGIGYFSYDYKNDTVEKMKIKTNGGTPFDIQPLK